jgi:predicted ATPase/DNA-binding SARP family transcriptional activator
MRFGVLGPVEVTTDDGIVTAVTSPSQRTVLAVLLARPNQVVPVHELVRALWGDDPPATAVHSLRTYVSRLRSVVGPAIVSRAGGFILDVEPDRIDAVRFDALVGAASTGPPDEAVEQLRAALALWRGPAFCDCDDVDAVRGEAMRLDECRRSAREALAAALLAGGRPADAVAIAEGLVADEPLREGAWTVLVRALPGLGRPAEALRAYQRAAEVLADVGLEPSAELRRAEAAVLAGPVGVPLDGRVDGAGPVGVPGRQLVPATAVPIRVPRSSLVGRDDELRGLGDLVRSASLVTLVGPGGVGKTRLATEIAVRATADHRFGCRMVELAGLVDPDAVLSAVADGLGVSDATAPQRALEQAGSLDVVVVLDNCEHVLDAAAEAAELLLRGGRARVLATSRERLGVDGEHVWDLGPLATGVGSPARALFLDRARAADRRLDLTDGALDPADLSAVDRIVHRLAGLPLAIEMAAARVATVAVPELAEILDERLDVLRSPRRHGDARHRTLQSVIEWSERLLSDEERSVFAALSVFAGPVGAEHIDAVLGAGATEVVRSLAGKSLVHADRSGPRARFSLLETIRVHAAGRAAATGTTVPLARRHADHFAAAARQWDADLRTPREAAATAAFDAAFGELRAAHRWSRRHDPALAADLSAALHLFAYSRLRPECFEWATPLADLDGPEAAVGLAAAGARAALSGDLGAAHRHASAALERTGDDAVRLRCLEVLGDVATYEGRLDDAVEIGRRLTALAERSGDAHHRVIGVSTAALGRGYAGRADEALSLLAGVDRVGLAPSIAGWLDYSAGEVVLDDDPPVALASLKRALAQADEGGNRFLAGVARVSITSLRSRVGDPVDALRAFAEVIGHWRGQGDQTHLVTTLRNLVPLFQRIDAAEAAAALLGSLSGDGAAPTFGVEAARLAEAGRWARKALGSERFERAFSAGAGLTVVEATDAALRTIDERLDS